MITGDLSLLLTFVGVALGEYPRLRMNRATIALVGAVALVTPGAVTPQAALLSIDANTIVLLFGMMLVNAHLRLAGFFDWVSAWIIGWSRSPRALLAGIIIASGVLSAFLLNDTIVLMFTPVVLRVTGDLRRNPVP